MKLTWIFLLLLGLSTGILTQDVKVFDNRLFELIFDRIELLFENPNIAIFNLRIKKIKKERVLNGNATLFVPFGNDVSVEAFWLKKQGGEYRYTPFRIPPTPLCDFVKNDTYFYSDFAKGSDFPEDIVNNCPLVAKTYSIYNVTCNLENVPGIKQFAQSGDYCAEVFYHFNGEVATKYRLYVYINNV